LTISSQDIRGDEPCPLCGNPGPFEVLADVRKRRHRLCGRCRLIFVEAAFLPSPEAARTRYAAHRNGPDDAGYLAFLRQALDPALPHLNPRMRGLDYGCGRTPTLAGLLEAAGLTCARYDPFFFPDAPTGPLDFLFATEVVEHFIRPAQDWASMTALLRPGGLLVAMTAPWTNPESFRSWDYTSDATHVAFYNRRTLDWIGTAFGFQALNCANPRVTLFRKQPEPTPPSETHHRERP